MDKSLLSNFRAMEKNLDILVADLKTYPSEILSKKPRPGAWSVMEIIQHMMIAERGSFAYLKKKTSYPDALKEAGLSDYFRKIKLFVFLHIPIKVKAPAVVNEDHFDPEATFENLVSEWYELRQEIKYFLDNAPNEWLNKLTYRHAFAGRMTFDGMLLFFRYHFTRHRKQIDRTLTKLTA